MIYFLQSDEGGPVKIGTTEDLKTRLVALTTHYGKPLSVLATLPGGRDEEVAIHERFSHLRFGRTEQFRPAVELMAFIGRPLLVDSNPDAVEAMPRNRQVGVTIRVDADSADSIKLAATLKGVGIMDYVRDVLAPIAKRDAETRMKKRLKNESAE